ncbi:MAG: threonine ammonia-lyase [Anaerolineales bacterium]
MTHSPLTPDSITLADIRAARERLAGSVLRTPLIRLNVDDAPAEIYLKLENLQPIGAFKLRGAGNAIALASPKQLANGVYTASAGNMAQGVAWSARRLGVPCSVIVPEHAPEAKLAAITRLGAGILKVPYAEWWNVIVTHHYPGQAGLFVHPVSNPHVVAGNGTIGLEIVEDLPDVDAVVVPYGGGGLSSGIATAIRALKPSTKVYAAEPETGAAFAAALAAGAPTEVSYTPSFVEGSGSRGVLAEMWPLVSRVLDGGFSVSLSDTAAAIRLMIERNRVVAEGAGALAVAAALSGKAGGGRVVCIVSGGNIDSAKVAQILNGEVP